MDITIPPGSVAGALTPPCSKSYAQRALAASLLAEGESTLHNIEFCDDTRSALHCIRTLGADVRQTDSDTLRIRGGLAPAATGSMSVNRGSPHGCSRRWPPSWASRCSSKARVRCSAGRCAR